MTLLHRSAIFAWLAFAWWLAVSLKVSQTQNTVLLKLFGWENHISLVIDEHVASVDMTQDYDQPVYTERGEI